MLAGFDPETITPRAAAEPTGELRNGSNAVPSYMAGCINGKCGGAGSIRSERVLMHSVKSPFFTGPLRSPLRLQNTFAHECFMDEISAHVKADPVAYRLQTSERDASDWSAESCSQKRRTGMRVHRPKAVMRAAVR